MIEPTAKQLAIIQAQERRVVVDAAVGSGKTFVLTERIRYYIHESAVEPARILAVTFTRRAARELKTRLVDIPHGDEVWAGTLHAWCAEVLHRWGYLCGYPRFLIIDEDDAKFIKHGIEQETGGGLTEYFSTLRKYRAIDFAGLENLTLYMLKNRPEVLRWVLDSWRYVFVDEAQDLNPAQWEIVEYLAQNCTEETQRRLTIIGDSCQSIYGWRGVRVERFKREEGARYTLNENFRSAAGIITRINRLMDSNPYQPEPIVAMSGRDAPYSMQTASNTRHMGGSSAILCRTQRDIRKVEQELDDHSIEHFRLGRKRFTEQTDVKLAINLWRLVLDPECELPYLIDSAESLDRHKEIDTFAGLLTVAAERALAYQGLGDLTAWFTANNVSLTDRIVDHRGLLDELILSGGDDENDPAGIAVGTVHTAKGMEWNSVFVYNFIEGVFPHNLSKRGDDRWWQMEEERRVAYVAITRARDRVILHLPEGKTQSRYVKELGT